MFYEPNIYGGAPYNARIWHCNSYAEHWHSNIEIYICIHGQLTLRVEGLEYRMAADDVVMVAGNEAHEIICQNRETVSVVISFGYNLLGSDYSTIQNLSFEQAFFNLRDEGVSGRIRQPLSQITDILFRAGQRAVAQDWEIRSCLYAIAAYMSGSKRIRTASKERQARVKQLENMYHVLDFVSNHYREQVTVDDAAALTGYDKSYFCRRFHATTGMTFHRYLNYYRLSVACQQLAETNAPVAAVAEQAGFTSQKMMSRLFRDILGVTPTEYRRLPPEKRASIQPL